MIKNLVFGRATAEVVMSAEYTHGLPVVGPYRINTPGYEDIDTGSVWVKVDITSLTFNNEGYSIDRVGSYGTGHYCEENVRNFQLHP